MLILSERGLFFLMFSYAFYPFEKLLCLQTSASSSLTWMLPWSSPVYHQCAAALSYRVRKRTSCVRTPIYLLICVTKTSCNSCWWHQDVPPARRDLSVPDGVGIFPWFPSAQSEHWSLLAERDSSLHKVYPSNASPLSATFFHDPSCLRFLFYLGKAAGTQYISGLRFRAWGKRQGQS